MLVVSTVMTLRSVYEEDHALLEKNFRAYINGFSSSVDDIIEHFNYRATIGQMAKLNRLVPILNTRSLSENKHFVQSRGV